jgi:hypothetical protein
MNRSIPLSATLAVVLVSQVALGGCNKKEDVNTSPDTAASAPATGSMGAASAPMDGGASPAASDAAMAASR